MQEVQLKRDIVEDYFYTEAYKSLRTNLLFCGSNIKVIMFTSAMPSEGKSDVAFSCAKNFALIGKRTLLIDCDIRKSVLVNRYNLKEEVYGLSQYLTGQRELSEVIYQTDIDNLEMIFAGPFSPNPAELLEDDIFTRLIKEKREEYDYVIIDTPPMGNLIDGAVIARNCDGAVMTIESGAVSYRLEQKVKEQIEASGCRILGVVLNKVDLSENSVYGKYGKYGKYGRYGKYQKYGKYGKYGKYQKYEGYNQYGNDPDKKASDEKAYGTVINEKTGKK